MDKKISYKPVFIIGMVAVILLCPNLRALDTIFIKNGKIFPITSEPIDNGCLLIQEGKITKIAQKISPPDGAIVIDAGGNHIYPGLIALMTSVGLTGYPGAGNDQNEIGISTPQMDPLDALNPEDNTIEVTRIGGVTTVHTISGLNNAFNGKSIVINLEGNIASDMLLKEYTAQIINVGASRENSYPTTISGTVTLIKEKLNKALVYSRKSEQTNKIDQSDSSNPDLSSIRDLEMEALAPIVKGEIPAVFITQNEVTLRNALKLIKEYKLKGIIQANRGIDKYCDLISKEKIPILWAGTTTVPERWESYDLYYSTASFLEKNDILFAFVSSGFGSGSHNVRNLSVPASLSIAHGLSEETALKALTIYPAKIMGIDHMVGSLNEGKIANLVIWSGSPIQMSSKILEVIIKGKRIPLESFQTHLRDKYQKIVQERINIKK